MARLTIAAAIAFAGCSVPSLEQLEAERPRACNAEHPCGSGRTCVDGFCRAGTTGCVPSAELCNGEDDDCDGVIDEDASETCSTQHARERCVLGACELIACDYGYVDCDGDPDDGCERLITNAGCEQNLVTSSGADAGGA